MKIDLSTLSAPQKQQWLQHAIAPRPIAFASTVNAKGKVNLSPFSFFNLFSSNPPIVIFSPARRVRNNTIKHTLENILEVPEVVIHICDYDMVQQVSLSSCEYEKDVDEFVKAGFSKQPASLVKPPMVAEAKIQLECRVTEVKHLGNEGGAGNLIICEVLLMHVNDNILKDDGSMIDQKKMQHIARLGGDWYCVVNNQNLFEVEKPNIKLGIGFDSLPDAILKSEILTANNLGQLANLHEQPQPEASFNDPRVKEIVQYFSTNPDEMERELHKYAQQLLAAGKVAHAWQVLLS